MVGPRRVNDPGIAFANLPPIDAVLVSHAHYDHLDLPTLSWLAAAHRARIITPLGNDTIMRNHDPSIAAGGTHRPDGQIAYHRFRRRFRLAQCAAPVPQSPR
jgi:L-ascorbate metabolism protein UlaG (beta-lactamase superfamily)